METTEAFLDNIPEAKLPRNYHAIYPIGYPDKEFQFDFMINNLHKITR